MTLHVLIECGGILRAYVIQDGRRGENLLKGRHYRQIETAKTAILSRFPGFDIEFEVKE